MASNSVRVTLQIRHDEAADWVTRNPVLAQGEYGLETDTFLIKVGDGVTDWIHLRYLNKLNETYFKYMNDGSLTFSNSFAETINNIIAHAGGDAHLVINDDPVEPTDPVNLRFLEQAIAEAIINAHHLKRQVVDNLPIAASADPDTLYMVLAQSGDHYEEYMVINGAWDMVGSTGDGGSGGGFVLEVATESRLGGVKASQLADQINVTQEGFMTLNQVATTKLYVPIGDTFIIYGGSA